MAVQQNNGFGAGERSPPAGIYITYGNSRSDLNFLVTNREFSADRPVYTPNPRLSKNNTRQIVRNYAGRSWHHEFLGHSRSSWRPRLQPLQIPFRGILFGESQHSPPWLRRGMLLTPYFKAVLYPKLFGTTGHKAGRQVDAPKCLDE